MSSFDDASFFLSELINQAIETNDPSLKRKIRRLWEGERWSSIKNKYLLSSESSMWCVWWNDGVFQFMKMTIEEKKIYELLNCVDDDWTFIPDTEKKRRIKKVMNLIESFGCCPKD